MVQVVIFIAASKAYSSESAGTASRLVYFNI